MSRAGALAGVVLIGVAALGAAIALAPPAIDVPPPEVEELWQGHGPWCLPTAAAALARYRGHDLTPKSLVREVVVGPHGVAWTDLLETLRARGIEAELVFPTVPALQALLRYGPVVVSQVEENEDHAIVVEAWLPEAGLWKVMDPANPGRQEIAAGRFEPSFERSGRRTLVILPPRKAAAQRP